MQNGLIVVTQLPIIEEHLKSLSAEIDEKVDEALSLAVSPETVKTVKAVRADLNKLYKDMESRRKAVKEEILRPYKEFEDVYKAYVSVRLEEADDELKRKITGVESAVKQEKEEDLKIYFRELADSEHLDWLDYERGSFNVTLSKSMASLRKEVESFVIGVADSFRAIQTLPDADEVATEYKRTLNLGKAVETVKMRHKAIEQERREREHLAEIRRQKEEAAAKMREVADKHRPLSVPKKVEEQSEEMLTLTFTVADTLERLKLLKAFLDSNSYKYK